MADSEPIERDEKVAQIHTARKLVQKMIRQLEVDSTKLIEYLISDKKMGPEFLKELDTLSSNSISMGQEIRKRAHLSSESKSPSSLTSQTNEGERCERPLLPGEPNANEGERCERPLLPGEPNANEGERCERPMLPGEPNANEGERFEDIHFRQTNEDIQLRHLPPHQHQPQQPQPQQQSKALGPWLKRKAVAFLAFLKIIGIFLITPGLFVGLFALKKWDEHLPQWNSPTSTDQHFLISSAVTVACIWIDILSQKMIIVLWFLMNKKRRSIQSEDQPWFSKLLSEVVSVLLIATVLYGHYITRDNLLRGQDHNRVFQKALNTSLSAKLPAKASSVYGEKAKELERNLITDHIPPPDEENSANGGDAN